jgi:hypothetical protein
MAFCGVEDDVGPERQRPLDCRRGERVVDDDERWLLAALGGAVPDCRRRGGDVDELEVRVGRGFEPDEAGGAGQLLPEGVGACREIRVSGVDACRAVHALEVAIGAAINVVTDDDLVAGRRQLGDRRRRRRAAGEGDPVAAALEGRDRPLEPFARGVLRSRVLIAAGGPADTLLNERRRLVDRRADGAGQLVRLGAGVDRKRLEGGVAFAHRRIIADPGVGWSFRVRGSVVAPSRYARRREWRHREPASALVVASPASLAARSLYSEPWPLHAASLMAPSRTSIPGSLLLRATIAGGGRITCR